MLRQLLLTCSLAALLAAGTCDFTSGGPTLPIAPIYSLTGTWLGEATSEFGDVRHITLELRQSGANVDGSSRIAAVDGTVYFAGDVDGTHVDPDVSLVLRAEGYDPITAKGRQDNKSTLALRLTGSGWNDTPVTLRKQ